MTTIESILDNEGPMMSSDLARVLEVKENLPYNTASQRVGRDRKIHKIKGFFKSNQSLCFLQKHKDDGDLFEALSEALYNNGRKYWYCLNAIKLHGGMLSRKYLECYTNYPVEPLKKHIPFNEVMRMFVAAEILIFNGDDYLFSPQFSQTKTNRTAFKTIEAIKDVVLSDLHSITQNIGMISYNTGEKFAEFGKFRWGFKGVSAISGILEKGKNGYLLADILLGRRIYLDDVRFYIEKLKHIGSYNNSSRIIPFLIVDDVDKDALLFLKKHGIVVGFIKELFGHKYAETLKGLIEILNNAGASLKNDPNKYLDLITQLKTYNKGLVNNVRGTLFEFMVGHIHSVRCQSIDLGKEIISNNSRHELDIFATYSDKVVIVECKATKGMIDYDVIEKWEKVKIPAFWKYIKERDAYSKKDIEFEFWSTGGFTNKALIALESLSKRVKKYKVFYFQAEEIREKAIKMKDKKLKEVLDNFFLKIEV